ncbi:MAG TPA: class I SAM-dependent methyltransferase [Polyangiaceae bacterium]|nr:class I SAM-dependent methyltransferase [Polyangiaceae bacterium]
MSEHVSLESPHGQIQYQDSSDHFENGLLRLLALDREGFASWLRHSEQSGASELLARLADGFRTVRGELVGGRGAGTGAVEAGPLGNPGKLWYPQIAENPSFGVARSEDGAWGWLVREANGAWSFETVPPVYEESYFEGDAKQAGGYGQYAAQAGWRLEKATRQLRELQTVSGVSNGRALDLGSGYGYFRAALAAAGFVHEGIEISKHARQVAESLYGFSTMSGTLDDYGSELDGRYQLITLWDVIEHVADPVALLSRIAACLAPGGVVAIKTPNLDCPEAEVFGPYYHSLKREHLVYFTPRSLEQAARLAGLRTLQVSSSSHLLSGFVGSEQIAAWAAAGRGSDITAYFQR